MRKLEIGSHFNVILFLFINIDIRNYLTDFKERNSKYLYNFHQSENENLNF